MLGQNRLERVEYLNRLDQVEDRDRLQRVKAEHGNRFRIE